MSIETLTRPSGLLLCLVVLALGGCGTPTAPPKTANVAGSVTLDDKPLPEGEIVFSLPGEPPLLTPVKDGSFKGQAYVGTNRVEVMAYKTGTLDSTALSTDQPPKINIVAPQFNSESKLSADIDKSGKADLKFDVKSQ